MVASSVPSRKFVPQSIDLSDFSQIEPHFKNLLARDISTVESLEQWLLDASELSAAIDEYGSRKYIDKSCHTEDAEIEKAFMHFVENIEPKIKPYQFELQKKFLSSPVREKLSGKKYFVLNRKWQADVELFRQENVAIETDVTKLVTDYDKICGAMTVTFRGTEYTLQQLARFLEEPDRATRQEAWELLSRRRLTDREKIEGIFESLLPLREKIAKNAGLPDYRAYQWKANKRFDYTPEDCLKFADAIAETVVPFVRELDERRAKDLKLEKLRPWDAAVDPKNRPALRPFDPADIDGFVSKTREIFQRMSPELADQFESLRTNKDLDLGSRKGKQPGAYQSQLEESRRPFIFMNAAGLQRDVETLLHESGHAFHYMASRDEPLVFLRNAPMEFCEVASMAMEALACDHQDVFYSDPAEGARAKRMYLEGVVRFFPWMATIDTFQHWLYTHPGHSRAERTAEWLRILNRFSSGNDVIDWTGYEAVRESMWQRQLHLFHAPFYYIEYGIAQLGALQVWMKAKEDPRKALANYRAGLALAGTRPLPELFSGAGINFDFSRKTLGPLIAAAAEDLAALP